MRFVLYNIRYATGKRITRAWMDILRRTDDHFKTITEFITDLKPDVVGLVETDGGSFRMRLLHQAQQMALATGLPHHTFGVKYKADGLLRRFPVFSKQGNALLTKGRVQHKRFHYFRRGFKRLVIELELDQATLFLVHLSLRRNVRRSQLLQLQQFVAETSKPCIVAGDFNALMGPDELKGFLEATGMNQANNDNAPTYPSWNPCHVLDFVCYSPKLKLNAFTLPKVTLSDHLPLVCDFEDLSA